MIFNEADKGASGGSAAPSGDESQPGEKREESAPVAPAAPSAQAAPAAEIKPTIVQKFSAMIADKSELLGAIARHEKANGELQGKLTVAEARVLALEKELGEFEQIKAALKTAEEKSKSVEAAAADKISALGFPADKLPAVTAAESKPPAELKAQLDAIKDPLAYAKFYQEHKAAIDSAYSAPAKS